MSIKREKAPALYKKGPSYMMRIQYKENGVALRAAFKVGNVGEPIALAQRNAKVVRAMVKAGRVDDVPAFLAGKFKKGELPAGNQITVNEVAEEVFDKEQVDNPRRTAEVRALYAHNIKRPIGGLDVASVTPALLRELIFEPMADKGKSQATLGNVRKVARKVFKYAIHKQLVQRNPVDDIWKMPKARVDSRKYVLPTDEEFVTLIAYLLSRPAEETVDGIWALELATLIVCSRFIGGQRTSDLHAWEWGDIDLVDWKSCVVRRPKTDRREDGELVQSTKKVLHLISADERHVLKLWWDKEGNPTTGLVFPTRVGKRAGKPKQGTRYATNLKVAMRRALGIDMPYVVSAVASRAYADGTTRAMPYTKTEWRQEREPTPREKTLLFGDNDLRPLTMHTMRRAYASGLALAGWSTAQMRTAGGWTTDAMPLRYDLSAQHAQVDASGTTPKLRLVGI